MDRIDHLENQLIQLQGCLQAVAAGKPMENCSSGASQNLMDREIVEFLEGSA
jgi:serine O-acetyltransferase